MADTSLNFGLDAPATSSPVTVDDWTLVDGLQAGDDQAFEALIQRFEQPVFGVVSRLVDDAGDAADVVQEVFLKIFRNIGGFRGDSSLKTWIYRIAVNEARNQHRWFGRHRGKEFTLEPSASDVPGLSDRLRDPGPSPFQLTLDHEMRAMIEMALQSLGGNQRTVLVLREIEGLSYEEIGQILGISLGTVKSRILRGREALRRQLQLMLEPANSLHDWPLLETQGSDAV